MWYSEVNACGPFPGCRDGSTGVTGHFTALIWDGVKEIGCHANQHRLVACQYKGGDKKGCTTPNMGGSFKTNVFSAVKTKAECEAIVEKCKSGGDPPVVPDDDDGEIDSSGSRKPEGETTEETAPEDESADHLGGFTCPAQPEHVREDGPGVAQEFLDAHNLRRCMHGVPALSWSSVMYDHVKQTFQNQKQMKHSPSYNVPPPAGPAGENLAFGSYVLSPEQSTQMWYSEVNACGPFPGCRDGSTGVTGHFTALIWSGVKEIGCHTNQHRLVACQYKGGDTLGSTTPNMGGNFKTNVFAPVKTKAQCEAILEKCKSGGDAPVVPDDGDGAITPEGETTEDAPSEDETTEDTAAEDETAEPTPKPSPELPTHQSAPSPNCPARCSICKAGGAADGGVKLNNGVCSNWCSRKGHCGGSKAYKYGGTDCTGCTAPEDGTTEDATSEDEASPEDAADEEKEDEEEAAPAGGCPSVCTTCKSGTWNRRRVPPYGGVAKVDGVCQAFCSKSNYCGFSNKHREGTDCSGCIIEADDDQSEQEDEDEEEENEDIPDNRCGPLFQDHVCNCNGDLPKALYCNERNGWCGPTAAHRDAQESTKYDCVKKEPTPKPTAEPTPKPTSEPTAKPTPKPTAEPTPKPTPKPTPLDCSVEPQSMNGPSKPKGCAGAVWTNGSPAKKYCDGQDGKYPWWAACCEWTGSKCIPTSTEDATSEDETTSEEEEIPDNRCGPLFQDSVCDCNGDMPKALYCNERNGWCGPTAAHRDAQESTKYDCVKEDQSHPVDTLVNAAMCDNSPPQMCRKMCPAMKCPANQCAMRTGSCCDFTCQATNGDTPEEPIASDADSEDGTTEDAANPQCTTGRRYNSNQVAVKGCRANVLPKGTKFCLNGETFTVGSSWNSGGGATVTLATGERTKANFFSEGDELTIGACVTSADEHPAPVTTKPAPAVAKKTYKIVLKLPLSLQSMTAEAHEQLSAGAENALPCGLDGLTCFAHARGRKGVSLIQSLVRLVSPETSTIAIIICVSGPPDKIAALPDPATIHVTEVLTSLKKAATDPKLVAALKSANVNEVTSVEGPAWIEGKNAENGGISCLTADGTYADHLYSFHSGGHGEIWYGDLAEAKKRCDANDECVVLHDWDGDGRAWRACRSVVYNDYKGPRLELRGPAHTMVRAI